MNITPDNPLKRADSFYEQEDYESALKIYQTLLSREKRNEEIAILQNNIGLCFYNLEKFDTAEKYFKLFLNTLSLKTNPNWNDIAIANSNIGDTLSNKLEKIEAIKYYKTSLKTYLDFSKEIVQGMITENTNIGHCYYYLEQYSDAEPYYISAKQYSENLYDQENDYTNLCRFNLAENLNNQEKTKEAFDELTEVYYYLKDENEYVNKIDVLNHLTNLSFELPFNSNHEKYYTQLYSESVLISGNESLDTGISAKKLGRFYLRSKDYVTAAKHFEIAFSIYNKTEGEFNKETLNIASFLGEVYYSSQNFKKSKNIFEYILSVQRREFKDNEKPLLDAIANLAYACFRFEDFSNAKILFKEAIFLSSRISNVILKERQNYILFFVDSLHKLRQYSKAADNLKSYINSEIKNDSADKSFLASLYSRLALNLGYTKNKAPESEIYYLKSIDLLEKQYPDNQAQICEEKYELAALYRHKLFDDKKSITVLYEVLEELDKQHAQKSAVYFKTQLEIGGIYNSSKKYSSALPFLKKAFEHTKENFHIPDNWKINTLKEIAITEIGLGNKNSAQKYLTEANLLSQKYFGPKHRNTLAIIELINENFAESKLPKKLNVETLTEGLLKYNKFVQNELRSDLKKRNVRVFISSTFRDMMAERDYLMKIVFPEIKQICKQFGILFTEIDLRWGVTNEDVEQGKVIEICLNEIDNSRPYFIGILGERYGWIPDITIRSKIERTLENFDWLNQDFSNKLSITEMEIQYGVLRNKKMEGNAFFYLRDKKLTPENPDFFEKENSHEFEKLQKLKSSLRNQDKFPVRDFDTIKKLGDLIGHDLQKAIIRDSKLDRQITEIEKNRIQQINHIKRHCEFYIPNEENVKKLDEFLLGKKNKVVIFSPPGKGKSALLSNWIKKKYSQKKGNPILFHFSGASNDKDHVGALRWVILDELIALFNINNRVDYDNDNIVGEFEKIFNDKNITSDIVIILDGIERIKQNPFFAKLYWLPLTIPRNIKLIISTNNQEYFDILLDREFMEILPEEMNYFHRKKFVVNHLARFGKKLPENLIKKLLADEVSDSPFTLQIILNELRIMGKHEDLESELTKYLSANDTVELFIKVLERVEEDFDSDFPGLISKALSFISISKSGLTEHEIIDLTNSARLYWSPVQNSLENYLSRTNEFITINNPDFLAAVRMKFLSDKNIEKEYKTILANYLLKSDNSLRKAAELSELLYELGDRKNLAELITDVNIFNDLIRRGIEDLNKYHNLIKEDFNIVEIFKNKFKKEKLSEDPKVDFIDPLRNIAKFLIWIFDLDNALFFAEESYKLGMQIFGETHPNTAKSIIQMADIHFHLENKLKAKDLYLKAAAIIEKDNYKNRLDLGLLYISLAEIDLAENNFEEARKYALKSKDFFKTIWGENSVGIANALLLIGEIELKNENYEKAEQYTKEALKLLEITLGKNHVSYQTNVLNLVNIYEQKGDNKQKLELLIEQEKVFSSQLGADNMLTISVKTSMASIYFGLGDFEKAEQISKDLLETAEKYKQMEDEYALISRDLLLGINNLQKRKTDRENVKQDFDFFLEKEVLEKKQQIEEINENFNAEIEKFEENIEIHNFLGARDNLNSVINLNSQMPECMVKENNIGIFYLNVGKLYFHIDDMENSIKSLTKSLHIFKKNNNLIKLSESQTFLGDAYYFSEDYQNAIFYHKEALGVYEKLPKRDERKLSQANHDLGLDFYMFDNYEDSIIYYKKAIDLKLKLFGAESEEMDDSRFNLGKSYFYADLRHQAKECFNASLKFRNNFFGKNSAEYNDVVEWLKEISD